MNIYFDYDSNPTTANIVDKYLSRILMRIKTEIMQLTYTVISNAKGRPMPEGYVLVKVSGIDASVSVVGFDKQFNKEVSDALSQLALSQIIHLGSHA